MSNEWQPVSKKNSKVKNERTIESKKLQAAKNRFVAAPIEPSSDAVAPIADTEIVSVNSSPSPRNGDNHAIFGTINFKNPVAFLKKESQLVRASKKAQEVSDNPEVIAKIDELFEDTLNAPSLFLERLLPTLSPYFDKSLDLNLKGLPWIVKINMFEDVHTLKKSISLSRSEGIPCTVTKVQGSKRVNETPEETAIRIYNWTRMGPRTREAILSSLSNVASRITDLRAVFDLAQYLLSDVVAHSSERILGHSTSFFLLYALCKTWPVLCEYLGQDVPASDEIRCLILSFHKNNAGTLTLKNYFYTFDTNYVALNSIEFLYALTTKYKFGCAEYFVILTLLLHQNPYRRVESQLSKLCKVLVENNTKKDGLNAFQMIMKFYENTDLSVYPDAALIDIRDYMSYIISSYGKDLNELIITYSPFAIARLASIVPSLSKKQLKKASLISPAMITAIKKSPQTDKDTAKYILSIARYLDANKPNSAVKRIILSSGAIAFKSLSAVLALSIVYRVVVESR